MSSFDLYDEFGNYIGADIDSASDGDGEFEYGQQQQQHEDDGQMVISTEDVVTRYTNDTAIILHEDKKYYPDASEIYKNVYTVTLDEDAQDISEPIIKSTKVKIHFDNDKTMPPLTYTLDFMQVLSNNPSLIRNIGIFGHLHHGKTLFIDNLVDSVIDRPCDPSVVHKYTDYRKDEKARELSIKSTPISLVLENSAGKSYLINMIDCPGHVDFIDESIAAMTAVDNAVIIIDAIEGVMSNTERLIKKAIQSNIPISLVINKVDRLILELKLPPMDTYFKLLQVIEEVNKIIADNFNKSTLSSSNRSSSNNDSNSNSSEGYRVEIENVCFASATHGWSFTINSFAIDYCRRINSSHKVNSSPINPSSLAKRLWGNWYHDKRTSSLTTKKSEDTGNVRTFVSFILEPLYKIYSHFIGGAKDDLKLVLTGLGVSLKAAELSLDPKPLLKLVLSRFFGNHRGFVDMITAHVSSPLASSRSKIALNYTGLHNETDELYQSMLTCNANGPLVIHVMKLYSEQGNVFKAFGRVYSGTIRLGQKVKVLGELYSTADDEDMNVAEVTGLSIGVGCFSVKIDTVIAGNWVMIEGVDSSIKKTATICDINANASVFRPLPVFSSSVVKIAVEPINPSELPRLIDGLRKINKSYPSAVSKVEDSGEHVILGPGELYLDCIMYDLRNMYSEIEIKVADPVVSFRETVSESSAQKCTTSTPNNQNSITTLVEPLDQSLAYDIESGSIKLEWDRSTVSNFFSSKYGWDKLAARSVWAFGPESNGCNIYMDDTIASDVDKLSLNSIKDNIIQGFQWGCREGPLCDEPIRQCKFRLLDAIISTNQINRGGGQIIPTARRNCYASFFMSSAKLMEPVYLVEMQAPADCVKEIYPVLQRRRGHVFFDSPKAGTPFFTLKAYIPVIDSFGFETDLRSHTLGQVFCQQVFDHWRVVPGDPLDDNIILHPLEPSPSVALARDFMIKTRRRKGLMEDVNISKYF